MTEIKVLRSGRLIKERRKGGAFSYLSPGGVERGTIAAAGCQDIIGSDPSVFLDKRKAKVQKRPGENKGLRGVGRGERRFFRPFPKKVFVRTSLVGN